MAADLRWVQEARFVTPDWPPVEKLTTHSAWRVGEVPVAEVHDSFISRRYVLLSGDNASIVVGQLIQSGDLISPDVLVEAAQRAEGATELGNTLYDLVAGCVDATRSDVYEVWASRLADGYPLLRLVACWVAPYLSGDDLRKAVESTAAADVDEQIRAAARASAAVMAQRSSS
jgi:hypothetical protein